MKRQIGCFGSRVVLIVGGRSGSGEGVGRERERGREGERERERKRGILFTGPVRAIEMSVVDMNQSHHISIGTALVISFPPLSLSSTLL